MKPFIKTSDKQTADKLKQQGFQLISTSAGIYTFTNDPEKSVDVQFADDLKKFSFSNMLEF